MLPRILSNLFFFLLILASLLAGWMFLLLSAFSCDAGCEGMRMAYPIITLSGAGIIPAGAAVGYGYHIKKDYKNAFFYSVGTIIFLGIVWYLLFLVLGWLVG